MFEKISGLIGAMSRKDVTPLSHHSGLRHPNLRSVGSAIELHMWAGLLGCEAVLLLFPHEPFAYTQPGGPLSLSFCELEGSAYLWLVHFCSFLSFLAVCLRGAADVLICYFIEPPSHSRVRGIEGRETTDIFSGTGPSAACALSLVHPLQ